MGLTLGFWISKFSCRSASLPSVGLVLTQVKGQTVMLLGLDWFCTLIPVIKLLPCSSFWGPLILVFVLLPCFSSHEFLPCPDAKKCCLPLMLGYFPPLASPAPYPALFISLPIGFFPRELVSFTHTRTFHTVFLFKILPVNCHMEYPNNHPATVGGSVTFLLFG